MEAHWVWANWIPGELTLEQCQSFLVARDQVEILEFPLRVCTADATVPMMDSHPVKAVKGSTASTYVAAVSEIDRTRQLAHFNGL